MPIDTRTSSYEELITAWSKDTYPERFLSAAAPDLTDTLILALKECSDRTGRSDPQRALALADSIVESTGQHGTPLQHAWALMARGNARKASGRYLHALGDYDDAQSICRSIDEQVQAARSQIGALDCLTRLARYDEALDRAGAAEQVLVEHEQWLLAARMADNAATVHYLRGAFGEALTRFQRAAIYFMHAGANTQPDRITNLLKQADLMLVLGRYGEATAQTDQALELARANRYELDIASAEVILAKIASLRGQHTRALYLLQQATDRFAAAGVQIKMLITRMSILECYLALNRLQQILDESPGIYSALSAHGLINAATHVVLDLEVMASIRLGRYEHALQTIERALAFFEQQAFVFEQARLEEAHAEILLALGRPDEAWASAEQAALLWKRLTTPAGEIRTRLLQARIRDRRGEYANAQHLAGYALSQAKDAGLPDLAFAAQLLLARISEMHQDYDRALTEYLDSITTLEFLRYNIAPELRSGFIAGKEDPYAAAVQLSLQMGKQAQAFQVMEQGKSRTLVELLATNLDVRVKVHNPQDAVLVAELERLREERNAHIARLAATEGATSRVINTAADDTLRRCEQRIDEILLQLQVRSAAYAGDAHALGYAVPDLAEIQAQLGPDTLLLEYYIARDEVLAWTIDRSGVAIHRHLCTTSAISTGLSALKLAMAMAALPGGHRLAQQRLGQLHELLIRPLAERLAGFRQIIVVPHGLLHYLPFHALYDSDTHRYLVETHALSYLPCASLLPIVQEQGRRCRAESSDIEALIVAHSAGGWLPSVRDEASRIAQLFPGSIFTEHEATVHAVRDRAEHYRLLHIAAHGRFRPDAPLFSAVQLEDGELTVIDLFNLNLKASLVTLSACETGNSAVSGGDELIGLARACLYAGAASLLLTLWRVDDRATAGWIETFYQTLRAGKTKAEAMRATQLAFLHDEQYSHPAYWAPFVLIGDAGEL